MLSETVQWAFNRTVFLLALFGLSTGWAQSSVTIERYVSLLDEYRVTQTAEFTDPEQAPQQALVSPALLNEYLRTSYSQWEISPLGNNSSVAMKLEVYEMLDSLGAFGLYSIWPHLSGSTSGERLKLSVDNRYDRGNLIFWRGNFFFRLSMEEPDFDPEILVALAKALVDQLNLLNLHPLTVILLPKEDLIFESIRYYLGEVSFGLSNRFPPSLVPHLGLDKDVEITEASYSPEDDLLFLVGYPTPALASTYYLKLQDAMKSYFSPQGVYLTRAGVVVGIFFGPEQRAQAVLGRVQYAPDVRWLHEEDYRPKGLRSGATSTVLHVVRRTLGLILAFLIVAITAGFAVGMVRYEALRRISGRLAKENLVFLELDKL